MHYFSTLPDVTTNDMIGTQSEKITYKGRNTSHRLSQEKLSSTGINKLEFVWSSELPKQKPDLEDYRSELEKLLQFFSLNDLVIL